MPTDHESPVRIGGGTGVMESPRSALEGDQPSPVSLQRHRRLVSGQHEHVALPLERPYSLCPQ